MLCTRYEVQQGTVLYSTLRKGNPPIHLRPHHQVWPSGLAGAGGRARAGQGGKRTAHTGTNGRDGKFPLLFLPPPSPRSGALFFFFFFFFFLLHTLPLTSSPPCCQCRPVSPPTPLVLVAASPAASSCMDVMFFPLLLFLLLPPAWPSSPLSWNHKFLLFRPFIFFQAAAPRAEEAQFCHQLSLSHRKKVC